MLLMNYAAGFRVSQATLQNWVKQANCEQSCVAWQLVLLRARPKSLALSLTQSGARISLCLAPMGQEWLASA